MSTATPTRHLETDYLILGAGATGMAFADVILAEDASARIVMVDRHADPGGHWNDAYSFVRLHQPSAFYGLNSTYLGPGGAYRSSAAEIVAYYRSAMDRFLGTGRVQFLPLSEYESDGRIVSKIEPDRVTTVTALRRIVDSTYSQVAVPSVHPPRYTFDDDITVIPPNGLVQVRRPSQRYVVVGAGKTGIDALLFLLDQGVSPDRLQWIVPNDAWLLNRASMHPKVVLDTTVSMTRSTADADNIDGVFLDLERQGILFRLDTGSLPSKWRCATVDPRELAELRRIDDVIRMGRVQHIGNGKIRLDHGTIEAVEDSLFIDCTADGLAKKDPLPLFSEGRVTIQPVFMCQQTFGAALIAHLELLDVTDARRNRICTAVPLPELKDDLPTALITTARNMINCNRYLPVWLRRSRLYLGHHAASHHYLLGSGKLALLQRRAVASTNRMRQQATTL